MPLSKAAKVVPLSKVTLPMAVSWPGPGWGVVAVAGWPGKIEPPTLLTPPTVPLPASKPPLSCTPAIVPSASSVVPAPIVVGPVYALWASNWSVPPPVTFRPAEPERTPVLPTTSVPPPATVIGATTAVKTVSIPSVEDPVV